MPPTRRRGTGKRRARPCARTAPRPPLDSGTGRRESGRVGERAEATMTKDDFLKNLARCLWFKCPRYTRSLEARHRRIFANRMEPFYVEDLIGNGDVSVILVCESPHTDEINQYYPLAGGSGKAVTATLARFVFGRSETWNESMGYPWNQPIGKLVKSNHPCFRWLGIMNVCPIPLQEKPYNDNGVNCPRKLIKPVKTIRGLNPTRIVKKRRDSITRRVQSVILRSFKYRIRTARIMVPNATVIPCGKFAEAAFTAIGDNVDICGIPHLSHSQWSPSNFWAENIEEMCKEIRRRIEIASVRSRP